jgi:hypothetical protein
MNNRSQWLLALLTVAGAMSACGVAEESPEKSTESALLMYADDYYDTGSWTTVNGVTMHACRPDPNLPDVVGVMVGAHLVDNVFRCQDVPFSQFEPGGAFIDGPDSPTHTITTLPDRPSVHRCPGYAVMIGYHQARNDLLCMNTKFGNFDGLDINGASDGYMHVCANLQGGTGNSAMTGLDPATNTFLCTNS